MFKYANNILILEPIESGNYNIQIGLNKDVYKKISSIEIKSESFSIEISIDDKIKFFPDTELLHVCLLDLGYPYYCSKETIYKITLKDSSNARINILGQIESIEYKSVSNLCNPEHEVLSMDYSKLVGKYDILKAIAADMIKYKPTHMVYDFCISQENDDSVADIRLKLMNATDIQQLEQAEKIAETATLYIRKYSIKNINLDYSFYDYLNPLSYF